MEDGHPTMLELLLEAHIGLERQGPGSPETVRRALAFLGPPERFQKIADLGCGTGGQTLLLAQALPGEIVGLDLFPAMAEKLNERARARGFGDRVRGVAGDMGDLPFERQSFDLIWSEGAVDNIGLEAGLRHWRDFLRPGGCVAVSCPCWLTPERPEAVARFWAEAGSPLDAVETNVGILRGCGYRFVAAFALTEDCWTEHYFAPRERAIQAMLEKYPESAEMQTYAALNRDEVALYRQFGRHYGYVFFIGRLDGTPA
ncbi:MAG: class I SAM-dependent methyltransferase [Oscillospiraceae bacterium]|nr:class I SAM-dependent methyltransferase [Oscillospiraceae bacterium]